MRSWSSGDSSENLARHFGSSTISERIRLCLTSWSNCCSSLGSVRKCSRRSVISFEVKTFLRRFSAILNNSRDHDEWPTQGALKPFSALQRRPHSLPPQIHREIEYTQL